jgi:hypothetical protein
MAECFSGSLIELTHYQFIGSGYNSFFLALAIK